MRHHLLQIESTINFCSEIYENFIVLGDSNAGLSNLNMESLCTVYNIEFIVKDLTLRFNFRLNLDNLSCIYLILTNGPKYFQLGSTTEITLLDILKMTLTVFKYEIANHNPNVISDQKCKHSDNDQFKIDVLDNLSMQDTNYGP